MQQNKFIRYIFSGALVLAIGFVALLGVYDFVLPDRISCRTDSAVPTYFGLRYAEEEVLSDGAKPAVLSSTDTAVQTISGQTNLQLFGLIPLKTVQVARYSSDIRLCPGGMPFGVKLYTDGILVIGFEDVDSETGMVNPAYAAGLREKDIITHLNGSPLNSVEMLTALIESSGGAPITVTYTRGGVEYSTTITPVCSRNDGRYKTGMWVRDSGAGIGTVTFIEPKTGEFGGLGHGICDIDTGELMPMQRGIVVDVTINGVVRGAAGAPGELRGSFLSNKCGALLGNTNCGVYGVFSSLPESTPDEAIPIALRDEIHTGKAHIRCTLDESGPQTYEIEILSINKSAAGAKNFVIKVTDPVLLEKTGGIVQGMSGSPIIQDGKLAGAVTHVLINDPTRGYGIFIENMLDAPQIPMAEAS